MLEFANGQRASDPRDGLALYGPFSFGRADTPPQPSFMIVGHADGIRATREWLKAMNGAHVAIDHKKPARTPAKQRIWPTFPGFDVAFGHRLPSDPVATVEIPKVELLQAASKRDPHERCFAVVELFLAAFARLENLDNKPSVLFCVVPDEVQRNCRTKSRVTNPSDRGLPAAEKRARAQGQRSLFDQKANLEQYQFSPDFRRQLKARAMEFGVPIQIFVESTLQLTDVTKYGARTLTPMCDRMWNTATALYYKAGGKPWKLATARDGVCYVGIAFRRVDDAASPNTACCAAQMFIDSGDGIVFLGDKGPWYSDDERQFHLTRASARNLLAGILKTHGELNGKALNEIFLHSHSDISAEEFAGYSEACPPGCKIVGVRVRDESGTGIRLYRNGTRPVLRGTFLKLGDRYGLLYAAGFKQRIATYDGWETPVPLRIDIQHGEADIAQVAADIFGLTKLNYNACRVGDGAPVTVAFSDAVGEILVSNPTVKNPKPTFKFYI